jgi:tetratricopeptide (TPR) repeat protein
VHSSEQAWTLGNTALQCYFLGHSERAVDYGERGCELARDAHHGESLLFAGGGIALGLIGLGCHEEALAQLEPLVAQGRDLGTVGGMTARALNIWGGALREICDLEGARALHREASEMAASAPFPIAEVQAGVDLLFTDLAEGEVGRAEAAWPGLWEAAQALKGFHQWLVSGRLEAARAEISLGIGKPQVAAEEAARALASASRVGRLKYEMASRLTLGLALAQMGRASEGEVELRRALAGAEQLGHPPSQWRTAAALGRALLANGDETGGEAAMAMARDAVQRFAAILSEERREGFLSATAIGQILAAAS